MPFHEKHPDDFSVIITLAVIRTHCIKVLRYLLLTICEWKISRRLLVPKIGFPRLADTVLKGKSHNIHSSVTIGNSKTCKITRNYIVEEIYIWIYVFQNRNDYIFWYVISIRNIYVFTNIITKGKLQCRREYWVCTHLTIQFIVWSFVTFCH